MNEIVIKLGKGHRLGECVAEIDALAREVLGDAYFGLSTNEDSVRLHVGKGVDESAREVVELIEKIRTFEPKEEAKPEPSEQDMLTKLDDLQRQLDELRAAIESPSVAFVEALIAELKRRNIDL
jgi:hypothetical protein